MSRNRRSLFFRIRSFLNPVSTGHTAYILVEAESSSNGECKWGHYMLTLADCRRRVQLEFFIGTKRARKVSLKKIDLLIDILTRFRAALLKEMELVERFEQSNKSKRSKAKAHD